MLHIFVSKFYVDISCLCPACEPRSGIAGSHGRSLLKRLENCQSVFTTLRVLRTASIICYFSPDYTVMGFAEENQS